MKSLRLNRVPVWVLLFLLIASCSQYRAVATVNSEKITKGVFDEYCKRKALLLGVEKLSEQERAEVLELLIQREVVYQYAKKRGYTVNKQKLQESLNNLGFFDRLFKKKDIEKDIMFLAMKRKITANVRVKGEEIRKYYESNKEAFRVPELYRIYLVEVKPDEAGHVLEKLKERPEAFEDMALKRVSAELRQINRNAPYVPKEQLPEQMLPFIEKMKVGDIAGPVETKRGTFIFKLVDKKPAGFKSLGDVYFEIEHMLLKKKKEEAFNKWYEEVKKDYKIKRLIDL